MADRNPSFFGPVLSTADHSVEAFSAEDLARIRARLVERELQLAQPSPWPTTRRFETIYARSAPERPSRETARTRRIEPQGRVLFTPTSITPPR
jgi:hypothetical protein